MATDLEDPLQDYNGLSLFPRTFSSLPNFPPPLLPSAFAAAEDDLLSIHNFLISLPVKNPDKLLEEAKSILESGTQLLDAEMAKDVVVSKDNDGVVVAEKGGGESPRGRRPGLGRKRAKFSLFPNASKPAVNLEPTLNIDKLKDPAEFFMAFERLENAKREIAKQTGRVSVGSNENNTSMAERPRRPGIPGRSRTIKYQHLYPTMSSQENFEEDVLSPSNNGLQQETTYPQFGSQETEPPSVASHEAEPTSVASQEAETARVASEEAELPCSVANAEIRVSELLDELFAHDYDMLDGDGAVTLLQDKLQIKPLDIEKLNLPELQDVQRIDLKASRGNKRKARNALADIHNLLVGTRNKTPMEQKPAEHSVSDSPLQSPLASLTSLRRRITLLNLASDPFSVDDIDQSAASNAVPIVDMNRSSEGADELLVDPKSAIDEDHAADCNMDLPEEDTIEDSICPHNISMSDNLTSCDPFSMDDIDQSPASNAVPIVDINRSSEGVDEILVDPRSAIDEDHAADCNMDLSEEDTIEDYICPPNISMSDNLTSCGSGSDLVPDKPFVELEHSNVNTESEVLKESLDVSNADRDGWINGPNESTDMVEDVQATEASVQPDANMDDVDIDTTKSTKKEFGQSSSPVVDEHQVDTPEENQDASTEQHNEKIQEPSVVSINKQRKAKSGPRKKGNNKVATSRQSLAASGTSWQTGVRRSTRIKSRPLEYWKGERFLYGRIHGSLPTVIGLKYESPAKDAGKPTVKVKSFVDDKFKHLVEQAALH